MVVAKVGGWRTLGVAIIVFQRLRRSVVVLLLGSEWVRLGEMGLATPGGA